MKAFINALQSGFAAVKAPIATRMETVRAANEAADRIQRAGEGYITRPRRGFSAFEMDLIKSDTVPACWAKHAAVLKTEYAAMQAA
ncbi:MAG: hypothetical protein GC134_09330 [Proteobacteria bacterium]|nr:hypothetical protein [Pseudomonadota bacterium]